MRRVHAWLEALRRHGDRPWYGPALAGLALVDVFLVFVPTDGIVVSSAMLTPRRWFSIAAWVTLGSTAGALLLAHLVQAHGLPLILHYYPGLETSSTWTWTTTFFDRYGLYLVFLIAASPLMQQPAVILAAAAREPLVPLTVVILIGRLLKFGVVAWIASHAPNLLKRLRAHFTRGNQK